MYRIEDNVYAKETERYGKSLFARKDFKKDELVFVAFGPVVTESNRYTIPIAYDSAKREFRLVEPRIPEGNLCQYICHSCEPNLGIKNRTCFVAMRDIHKNEEVTIDYAMIVPYFEGDPHAEEVWQDRTCLCGRKGCRGVVKGYFELSSEESERYRGYVSDVVFDQEF